MPDEFTPVLLPRTKKITWQASPRAKRICECLPSASPVSFSARRPGRLIPCHEGTEPRKVISNQLLSSLGHTRVFLTFSDVLPPRLLDLATTGLPNPVWPLSFAVLSPLLALAELQLTWRPCLDTFNGLNAVQSAVGQ